jgi:hypothetical protein
VTGYLPGFLKAGDRACVVDGISIFNAQDFQFLAYLDHISSWAYPQISTTADQLADKSGSRTKSTVLPFLTRHDVQDVQLVQIKKKTDVRENHTEKFNNIE